MGFGLWLTLAAVVVEGLILRALLLRNRRNDRRNAFLHVPLWTQEVIQLLLWASLAAESGAASGACRAENRALSLLEGAVVCAFPGWLALYASFGQPPTALGRLRAQRLRSWALLCAGFAAAVPLALLVGQWYGFCPSCTTAGPWGQQLWPITQLRPRVLQLPPLGCLAFLVGIPLFHVAHLSIVPMCVVLIWWTPVPLFVVIGDEWASAFSSLGSLLCVLYLAEPWALSNLNELNMREDVPGVWDDRSMTSEEARREAEASERMRRRAGLLGQALQDAWKLLLDTSAPLRRPVVLGMPSSGRGKEKEIAAAGRLRGLYGGEGGARPAASSSASGEPSDSEGQGLLLLEEATSVGASSSDA